MKCHLIVRLCNHHIPPPPPQHEQADVAAAMMTKENIYQSIKLFVNKFKIKFFPQQQILSTVGNNKGRTFVSADGSELHSFGLLVENEDPLPENMANVGTMNWPRYWVIGSHQLYAMFPREGMQHSCKKFINVLVNSCQKVR